MKQLFAIIAIVLLSGCAANNKKLTREEWIGATTRNYQNATKEEVIAAAERVWNLSDGDDYIIQHYEDGVGATRKWSIYLVLGFVMGTDYWRLTTHENNGNTKAVVQINTQYQTMTATPISTPAGTGAGISTFPMAGSPVQGTAIYDLFWSRIDYFLDRTKTWKTCKESDKEISEGKSWGLNEAMCNSFNVKDDSPAQK